jgi:hypothetical protein
MGTGAAQPTATDEELPPPSVLVTNEHYNRMARLAEKGIPVTLEFDIATNSLLPPIHSTWWPRYPEPIRMRAW